MFLEETSCDIQPLECYWAREFVLPLQEHYVSFACRQDITQ